MQALAESGFPFLHQSNVFWRTLVEKEKKQAKELVNQPEENIPPLKLAPFIDHTLLKPDAHREQIIQLCQEAIEHHFASVCVNPYWVKQVKQELQHVETRICTVIGFPLGATSTAAKVAEATVAIEQGAEELDMVINVGLVKEGNWLEVYKDIYPVVLTGLGHHVLTKVILETALLTDDEIVKASIVAALAGAAYVKTSTGFASGGASVHAVELMEQSVHTWGVGVKASGGIRDMQSAIQMMKAGATRIGASASLNIIRGI